MEVKMSKKNTLLVALGKFLKKIRLTRDKSQQWVANSLPPNCSQAYISRIENGRANTTVKVLNKILSCFTLEDEEKLEFATILSESKQEEENSSDRANHLAKELLALPPELRLQVLEEVGGLVIE